MIPDVVFDITTPALARLTSAYVAAPTVRALLTIALRRKQELELETWKVIMGRLIGESRVLIPPAPVADEDPDLTGAELATIILDANGVHLDTLGRIVGEVRSGRTDADFLVGIRAKIKANRSDGLAEDILKIATLAVPTGVTVTYTEPAEAAWTVSAYSFSGARTLAKLLGAARAGGVRGVVESSPEALTSTMRWASTTGASAGDTRGPQSSTGGTQVALLASALET